jgi:hypothetical protein
MRRLRCCNCRRILFFTRNPFHEAVNEKRLTDKTPRKDQGISSFSVFLPVKTQEGMLVRGLVCEKS